MTKKATRGISLVEVGIAFAILGLAIVPILSLFSGAGEQARQTADYGLALSLLTKVGEDLRVAAWEDTHLPDRMDTDPDFAPVASPVVGGQSPFFASLEDTGTPFGRIHKGADEGISPDGAALYRELSSYQLMVSSQPRSLPVTGQVMDVTMSLNWTDFKFRQTGIPMGLTVGRFADAAEPPDTFADRATADQADLAALALPANGTLTQVAAAAGGNLDMLRNAGDLVAIAGSQPAAVTKFASDIAQLTTGTTAGTTPLAALMTKLQVARMHESHAATELQAIAYLGPIVTNLTANYKPGCLGTAGPVNPAILATAAQGCYTLLTQYDFELATAVQSYFQCVTDPAAGQLEPRVLTRMLMKLSELLKLQICTGHPEQLSFYQTVLQFVKDHESDRNDNFYNFADYELQNFATEAQIKQGYAAPLRFQAWTQFQGALVQAITALTSG